MDQRPFEDKVMVIRFDKLPPKPLEWAKRKVDYFIDKNGFPIFIMDKDHARMVCTAKPLRYRLYCSPALDVRVTNPRGAMVWTKVLPWAYDVRRVQKGTDPENGEHLYENQIIWVEDKEEKRIEKPCIETITGEKPKSANPEIFDEHSYTVKKENARLIEENAKLTETIKEQGAQISSLAAKMDAMAAQVQGLSNKTPEPLKKAENETPYKTGSANKGYQK